MSHPGRQHAHQLALALQEDGCLSRFYTSIWYKPENFPYTILPYLLKQIADPIKAALKKRYLEGLDHDLIRQIPFYELCGRLWSCGGALSPEILHWVYSKFDKAVSRRLPSEEFDVFWGFENACAQSFQKAKTMGKMIILDLPIAHYEFQAKIWEQLKFNPYGKNSKLEEVVNKQKKQEIELADYIVVGSDMVKKSLLNAGVEDKKIVKIPYGFNVNTMQPKTKYNFTGETLKLLFVGSLTVRKGIEFLLEAVCRLQKKYKIELMMIGPLSKDAGKILKKYQNHFLHKDFMNQSELVRYYQDADVFLLPSLLEGQAQVILEAMACGTPVIATSHCGAGDLLRNGETGYEIPVMNSKEIFQKVEFLYKNRQILKQMGENARKAVEQFTWGNYRKNVAMFLKNLKAQNLS